MAIGAWFVPAERSTLMVALAEPFDCKLLAVI